MRTELITLATPTTPLDGAFYTPEAGRPVLGSVLLLHGNRMSFLWGAPRFLPPVLTALGYACLAFNRRGHDILSIRDSRQAEGAAFQLTHEAIEDNRLAAHWLLARGLPDPFLIGHSNGGMLAVRHVADHPRTPGLVLMSAQCGGQAMVRQAAAAGALDGLDLDAVAEDARARVAAGRGRELMSLPGWWYVSSAESFLDRMHALPDTLELAAQVRCPSLYLCGVDEPPQLYPAEAFAQRSPGPCTVVRLADCDHFYRGCEDRVAGCVRDWFVSTFAAARNTG
jgi:pimeloyl-ACP methyl ester carboxylesterase